MKTLQSAKVLSKTAYPNAMDGDKARTWTIDVKETRNGQYIVEAYKPYLGLDYIAWFSTEQGARHAANGVFLFIRDRYTPMSFPDKGTARIPGRDWKMNVCPQCEHINTLTSKMLPYGDSTTCTKCDYNHYYSIGD